MNSEPNNDPGKKKISQGIARILRRLGFSDAESVVFSELSISREPLSVEKLVSATGYGYSTVTTALNKLVRNHLVARQKSGKKYLYWKRKSFLGGIEEMLRDILQHEVIPLREELEKRKKDFKELLEEIKVIEKRLSFILSSTAGFADHIENENNNTVARETTSKTGGVA